MSGGRLWLVVIGGVQDRREIGSITVGGSIISRQREETSVQHAGWLIPGRWMHAGWLVWVGARMRGLCACWKVLHEGADFCSRALD